MPFNFNFSKYFFVNIGEGEDGKLGHNNRITLDKPKLIEALRSKRIRDIACGSSHSAAISSSGELYTWGLYIHFAHDIHIILNLKKNIFFFHFQVWANMED